MRRPALAPARRRLGLAPARRRLGFAPVACLGALALAGLGQAAAAQAPACRIDGTQAEITACARDDYARADAALNAAYGSAVAYAKAHGVDTALRAAQRAWLPYRDAECTAEAAVYDGGSMQPMVEAQCLARLSDMRARDLDDIWRDQQ